MVLALVMNTQKLLLLQIKARKLSLKLSKKPSVKVMQASSQAKQKKARMVMMIVRVLATSRCHQTSRINRSVEVSMIAFRLR